MLMKSGYQGVFMYQNGVFMYRKGVPLSSLLYYYELDLDIFIGVSMLSTRSNDSIPEISPSLWLNTEGPGSWGPFPSEWTV